MMILIACKIGKNETRSVFFPSEKYTPIELKYNNIALLFVTEVTPCKSEEVSNSDTVHSISCEQCVL